MYMPTYPLHNLLFICEDALMLKISFLGNLSSESSMVHGIS